MKELTQNIVLLTEKEVSLIIRKSVYWLRRQRWEGGPESIPYRKFGHLVRYDQNAVLEWIAQHVPQTSTSEREEILMDFNKNLKSKPVKIDDIQSTEDICKELHEYILIKINEKFDDVVFEEKEFISTLRSDIEEELKILKCYRVRMEQIERMIEAHAIGVQNIYNEFTKIKEKISVLDVDQNFVDLLLKLEKVCESLDLY